MSAERKRQVSRRVNKKTRLTAAARASPLPPPQYPRSRRRDQAALDTRLQPRLGVAAAQHWRRYLSLWKHAPARPLARLVDGDHLADVVEPVGLRPQNLHLRSRPPFAPLQRPARGRRRGGTHAGAALRPDGRLGGRGGRRLGGSRLRGQPNEAICRGPARSGAPAVRRRRARPPRACVTGGQRRARRCERGASGAGAG